MNCVNVALRDCVFVFGLLLNVVGSVSIVVALTHKPGDSK